MDQDRNKAWGFSLFGDDLRQEIGGKMSLMGMYQQDMIFHGDLSFPILVPKFAVLVMYYEIRGAIDADVNFRVTYGVESNVIAEVPILRKDVPPVAKDELVDEAPETAERIFHARMPIVLTPFPIEREGRLRVRAHYSDGAVLKLGSIVIRHMTAQQFQELVANSPAGLR